MRYPVIVNFEDASKAVGVLVPDIPGCYSAGDNLDEALQNSKQAILFALEDFFEPLQDIPKPSSIGEVARKYPNQSVAWVDVNLTKDTTRVNITVPKRLLEIIDAKAKQNNQSRSSYLIERAL